MTEIYFVEMLHGLVYGMLLFLVASGFTLVFGLMNVLNLSHTGFYMLGAYLAYSVTVYLDNFWLALIICPIITGIAGLGVEHIFLRKIHSREGAHAAELLLTFGIFYVISELIVMTWGSFELDVPAPEILTGSITFVGITYPVYRFFILAISGAILALMTFVLQKTRTGMMIKAAVSDAKMLDSLGVNVSLVFLGVFGGGSALAGLAGVIAAPFFTAYPSMGLEILIDCFVVVVVGGFGSLMGAFVAALMIGELHSFGVLLFPNIALAFQFLLMAGVLVFKPAGLFGEKNE